MNPGTGAIAAADQSAITATYELTLEDVRALAWFQAVNDIGYKYARRWQAAIRATVIVLIGTTLAALQDSMDQAMAALGIAIVIAGYFAWACYRDYPATFARYVANRYRDAEAPGVLGHHKLSVGSAGFTVASDHSTSEMRWSTIAKVQWTESHVFAFTGPMNAVIIPRQSLQGASFEEVRSAFLRHAPVLASGAE